MLGLARYLSTCQAACDRFDEALAKFMESNFVWVSTVKREETCEQRLAETLRALAAGRKWIDRKKA